MTRARYAKSERMTRGASPRLLAFFLCLGAGLALGFVGSALACTDAVPVKSLPVGGVAASVTDGDTVVLAGGRQVRLVGIQAPKLPLGRKSFAAWPLAEQAREALDDLVAGKALRLGYGGAPVDRHRRLLAHTYLIMAAAPGEAASEIWLQGSLLAEGLARVYSFADNRACVQQMLDLEQNARDARRGIWGDPYYAVRDAHDTGPLWGDLGSFQLVEGRIKAVADVKGRVFLNFDDDWRIDFTATVSSKDLRKFEGWRERLLSLTDARVRVRGWMDSSNGPSIVVTHPEQVEVLDGTRLAD